MTAAVLIALSLGTAGCSEWQGAKYINPNPPNDRRDGPGLFTGKEGGIVFYFDPSSDAGLFSGPE